MKNSDKVKQINPKLKKSEIKIPIFTFIVLKEFLMAVTWHISKGTKCIFDLNSDL